MVTRMEASQASEAGPIPVARSSLIYKRVNKD